MLSNQSFLNLMLALVSVVVRENVKDSILMTNFSVDRLTINCSVDRLAINRSVD